MNNKKIIAEYPIELSTNNMNLALYRFPDLQKNLNINRIKNWESCGYTEIEMNFPNTNVSACKLKSIGSSFITYKSQRFEGVNYFLLRIDNGKAILHKIPNLYMFEPYHHYYPVETETEFINDIAKEENDEEVDYMKTNNIGNIKKLMNDEIKVLKYEDCSEKYKNDYEFIDCNSCNVNTIIENEKGLFSNLKIENTMTGNEKRLCSNLKIENTIKNARIVNYSYLIDIFGREDFVKSMLIKLTTKVAGRFILKNEFYEESLKEKRTQLLDLFKHKEEIKIDSFNFLKEDQWLADEVAHKIGTNYILKGFYEKVDFNENEIKNLNRKKINDILSKHIMLGSKEISLYTDIEEDLINLNFQEEQNDYHHLANNGFVLVNDNNFINIILKELTGKKSITIEEIKNIFYDYNFEYDENFIISEMKKYCNLRSNKFFLKNLIK